MSSGICSRCSRIIQPGDLFYSLLIKVSSGFDGVINIKDEKYDISEEFEKVKSYPEELINEEVYREFQYVLCPRCKEIYCANPLNLPLGGSEPE
ncbi:MAG: hypothetical protein JSW49_04325 [candidate division WOR-3 bacterium]|nr:MAG: hypothetical protein JSW49_04325 [candidate division WOR-3 bacterium]